MPTELLSYGSYLLTGDLLRLQRPVSEPVHDDELLFITMHQTSELWFKQMLHELDIVARHLFSHDTERASDTFRRIHAIERTLEQQIDILETMMPQGFLAFRDHLAPASGFQSAQFREIEFRCGLRDHADVVEKLDLSEAERRALARRLREPSLYDAFKALLRNAGYETAPSEKLMTALRDIYEARERDGSLARIAEALTEFDERILLWRARHVRMVERMIGWRAGTGGSLGAAGYLQSTLERRMFPELWSFRTLLRAHA